MTVYRKPKGERGKIKAALLFLRHAQKLLRDAGVPQKTIKQILLKEATK